MITYSGPKDYEFIVIPHAKDLVEGLKTLGVRVEEFSIKGRIVTVNGYLVLHLMGELIISEVGYMSKSLPNIVSELLVDMRDRIQKDLKPLGVFIYLNPEEFKITVIEEKKELGNLVVDVPEYTEEAAKRFGKGLLLYLREKGIEVETLVISGYTVGKVVKFRILVVPHGKKEVVEKYIRNAIEKYSSFLARSIKTHIPKIEAIEVIDTKIKPIFGIILKRKSSIDREASKIASSEEIKSVLAKIRGLNENHRT
ncbi:hypothetical protein Py04_1361 [Pyrococcus sp. ST04]|nr:hypothetical protein Py04_1361 [Pyrococcus sp. ST04]